MIQKAKEILKRTLTKLEEEQRATAKKIRALKAALGALDQKQPNLAGRKQRRPMEPAERRSVSRRMKAYWSKRKRG